MPGISSESHASKQPPKIQSANEANTGEHQETWSVERFEELINGLAPQKTPADKAKYQEEVSKFGALEPHQQEKIHKQARQNRWRAMRNGEVSSAVVSKQIERLNDILPSGNEKNAKASCSKLLDRAIKKGYVEGPNSTTENDGRSTTTEVDITENCQVGDSALADLARRMNRNPNDVYKGLGIKSLDSPRA